MILNNFTHRSPAQNKVACCGKESDIVVDRVSFWAERPRALIGEDRPFETYDSTSSVARSVS